jgi:hypothetical protein
MPTSAVTVAEYLAALPPERCATLKAVRKVIRDNLDDAGEEGMQYGMIGYFIPHRIYPAGYHCDPKQPLPYASLGSRKDYMTLTLGSVYGDSEHAAWFRDAWVQTGKKLNMGAACIQFKTLDDLPLDVIAECLRRVPPRRFLANYQEFRANYKPTKRPTKKRAATKAVKKTSQTRKLHP